MNLRGWDKTVKLGAGSYPCAAHLYWSLPGSLHLSVWSTSGQGGSRWSTSCPLNTLITAVRKEWRNFPPPLSVTMNKCFPVKFIFMGQFKCSCGTFHNKGILTEYFYLVKLTAFSLKERCKPAMRFKDTLSYFKSYNSTTKIQQTHFKNFLLILLHLAILFRNKS